MRSAGTALIVMCALATVSCSSEKNVAFGLNGSGNEAPLREPDPVRALEYIPGPFQGRWSGEHHACAQSSADLNVMYLEPRKIIFWDSFAHVLGITAVENSELVLNVEYHEIEYSGNENQDGNQDGNQDEGATARPVEVILKLSADQDMLTTIQSGRDVQVRHRCPSA